MKILLVALIAALPFAQSAQMLDNKEGDALLDSPFFNQDNVRKNKIKSIRGYYQFKKINDRIRSSGLIYGCDFDTLGRLTKTFETRSFLGEVDTIVKYYEYNQLGQLAVFRKYAAESYYAEVYSYDSQNRLVRIDYRKDINKVSNPLQFLLDKQFLVSFETISHEQFENQEKRTHFNNFGLPFQYVFRYYNDLGYLTEVNEQMAVSDGQRKTTFTYNSRGLIEEKRHISTVMGNSSFRIKYFYDEIGNLLSSELYRSGELISEHQVIYNSKTGLISSVLKKQVDTQLINILNFDTYAYYH